MTPLQINFFGAPEFATIILRRLLKEDTFKIAVIICASDKPVGRKQILTPPPVKVLAEENNIPILQPEKIDDIFINKLKNIKSDLNIVVAYGKIMPLEVLNVPKYKSINVHPSLLPKYRGPSPIQTAILNGDSETGVTIMLMDEKMDHGPILAQEKLVINNNIKYKNLHDQLAELSAELLIKTIYKHINKKIKPQEQDHNKATFCKIIKKQDGEINWQKSAEEIYNQYRAFSGWPGVFMSYKNNILKLIEINLVDNKNPFNKLRASKNIKSGEFFINNKKLYIKAGDNNLLKIKKLQPQGKKVMDADSFINGYLN